MRAGVRTLPTLIALSTRSLLSFAPRRLSRGENARPGIFFLNQIKPIPIPSRTAHHPHPDHGGLVGWVTSSLPPRVDDKLDITSITTIRPRLWQPPSLDSRLASLQHYQEPPHGQEEQHQRVERKQSPLHRHGHSHDGRRAPDAPGDAADGNQDSNQATHSKET